MYSTVRQVTPQRYFASKENVVMLEGAAPFYLHYILYVSGRIKGIGVVMLAIHSWLYTKC